ncbi:Beta-glucanase [Madurella mycetomatis]|uniref:Beta-glucanase n=1 Tax=Madurella mycetomatis TaxID=100816 RepID=A0A175VTZ7_9PEZI|nr:Beta-glucanase [Madurella mycetomatis]
MSYRQVAVAIVLRWTGLARYLLPSLLPLPKLRRNGPSRHYHYLRVVIPKLLCWIYLFAFASADCECGYSTALNISGDNGGTAVFTDLIESDFTTLTDIAQDTEWVRQAFNLTRERARGDYGEMFDVGNVVVHSSSTQGDGEQDIPGLRLIVKKDLVEGMVPVAEIDTQRLDLFWGTFRASMKMTDVPGTCAAFFWYFNDTQEIDMEFLSKDFNAANKSYPVNLVLQSREAAMAGYDAALTGNFIKAYLPFNPTDDFHEYRIDYIPGRVSFYADGMKLAEMDGPAVPSSAGHLILRHWSNGNALWSGGPPTEDATVTVRYVKAYFNSSLPQRQRDWENRCRDPTAANAVCEIREGGWFFEDQRNMTNNQTASDHSDSSSLEVPSWPAMGSLLLVGGWMSALW